MSSAAIELVLFDLGGVLIELRGPTVMRTLAGLETDAEMWERWLECRWVRAFEIGQCSDRDFAEGVVADWKLPLSPAEFLAQFRDWPTGPFAGAEELVGEVKRHVPTGCLSNTNALHWQAHASTWPLLDLLDPRFLSFEMGVLKPDREVFDYVGARLSVAPERVLFLDDNIANVAAARNAGFAAARVDGVDGSRQALAHAGVIT